MFTLIDFLLFELNLGITPANSQSKFDETDQSVMI